MVDALHTGAAAFHALMERVAQLSNDTCLDGLSDSDDTRDYVTMAQAVSSSIEANMRHVDPAHREGYLRALTHLLALTADGCGPGADWAPLAATDASFAAPKLADSLLSRAAQW